MTFFYCGGDEIHRLMIKGEENVQNDLDFTKLLKSIRNIKILLKNENIS